MASALQFLDLYLVAIVAATAVAITLTNAQWADILKKCPQEDGEEVVHIPDPNDCHKFFKCNHGVPVPKECPLSNDGNFRLCYNEELQVCDWPWNVTCCNGRETTPSTSTLPTPSIPTLPTSPGGSEECPPTGSVKIPDKTDCRYYFECERGHKSERYKCRDGLYFNPIVQQCDRPTNVPNCPQIFILSA
ncbi:peritrophin-1-like [Hylaeus volcanicus]|uniref:peritrophin-1-like n=1 Tax=Hylaeus volcanicus TaxID=313075 RepID=UPI0023B80BA4|nr:peritrophin-1-like [Hylaeus volcanicus]